MKPFIFLLSYAISLFSCNSKSAVIRDFIPGTYVQYSENDMGRRHDTLQIEAISTSGQNYRIIRKSSFQRLLDRQAFPWEQQKQVWTAIYDEDKQVLNETKRGKVISFVREGNILLVGTTEYKKIK